MRIRLCGGVLIPCRFDAAASGVTDDDQMLEIEIQDSELDRRTDAVKVPAGFVGRNEVRDVAQYEELTGHRTEDRLGIDAAVRAGNDHRVRILTVRSQLFVMHGVGHEVPVLEALVTVGKRNGEAFHWGWGLRLTIRHPCSVLPSWCINGATYPGIARRRAREHTGF
jgi:hypothetical protein